MGAGPHRSGYNRRRKSQTIKLLPKKNSALLLLSSRSEKKGRNISLSLVAFLSEMDVIFDDARQVQRGTPSKHFNHIASSPRVCGRVAQWTTQRVNTKILATCIFSEGKREEGSHPCAMSDALSLLYDSLAIWLFFFSSSSHHSPPFCRLADWIPVMDGSWRASASHAPFQLRRLPLTVTGHSTYPCAQLTFFLSLYLSLPYFFFPFRRNGSERERRRRKNLWAISSSRPLERVIRLSLILGYFFFFLTSPRSLNTARRHSRYFSLSLINLFIWLCFYPESVGQDKGMRQRNKRKSRFFTVSWSYSSSLFLLACVPSYSSHSALNGNSKECFVTITIVEVVD